MAGAVLAAVAVLALADAAASIAGPHLREPLYWPTYEVQHKIDRLDGLGRRRVGTVLIGDSVLDSAADPAVMAAAGRPGVFNASLAGETLPTLADWAGRIVVPRLHPATVVLGFDANVLNGDIPGEGALVAEFEHSRPVAVADGRGDLVDHLDVWLHDHVALYRERSVLRQPLAEPDAAGGGPIYDPPLSAAGWNESFGARHLAASPAALLAAASDLRGSLLPGYRVSPAKLALLGRLIDRLEHEGAVVVVVAMPVSPAFVAAVPGGRPGLAAALRSLTGVARDHGARVLDAGFWPVTDFADGAHLDRAGTDRFSTWLANRLQGAG